MFKTYAAYTKYAQRYAGKYAQTYAQLYVQKNEQYKQCRKNQEKRENIQFYRAYAKQYAADAHQNTNRFLSYESASAAVFAINLLFDFFALPEQERFIFRFYLRA